MSRFKANITANLFGQILVIVTQLTTLPIYLHTLGVEAYGLIGFYVALQTTIQAFDLGLGNTINREMAKFNGGSIDHQKAISTVATIEMIFFSLIATLGLIASVIIPFYYTEMISAGSIPQGDIQSTLYLMCALIGLLWFGSLYQNGLMGLEKQVLFNIVKSVGVIANPIITLGALYIFEPKIHVFFLSQIFFSLIFIGFIRYTFYKKLNVPKDIKPVYSLDSLAGLKNYILGTGLIGAAGVIFSVSDRWILINTVPLKDFAHYTLALTMSNGLYLFITPVYVAIFPRFTALLHNHHPEQLKALYSIVSKLLTVFVLGIAIHLSLYSEQVFEWWLRDKAIVAEVYPVAQILVLGTAFNGMMILPFAMQLACGWIKIGLAITLGLLVVFVPSAYFLISHFGAIGCAIAWTSLNFAYFLIGSVILSRKLKQVAGFTIPLLFNCLTAIIIGAVAYFIHKFYPQGAGFILGASFISISFIVCISLVIAPNQELRNHVFLLARKLYKICSPLSKAT